MGNAWQAWVANSASSRGERPRFTIRFIRGLPLGAGHLPSRLACVMHNDAPLSASIAQRLGRRFGHSRALWQATHPRAISQRWEAIDPSCVLLDGCSALIDVDAHEAVLRSMAAFGSLDPFGLETYNLANGPLHAWPVQIPFVEDVVGLARVSTGE